MTTNGTNPGMSVEDYENMAVQKSNVAKRVAAGAAVFVGGAAVVSEPRRNPLGNCLMLLSYLCTR